tara:strand:+ start:118 stop:327 length:210 start_codon:yes stop_codon:yes gene_type:complete
MATKYQKHPLTKMDDKYKANWTELVWFEKGNPKTEKTKYPDRYMKKLFESGIEVVYEKHTAARGTKTTR